MTTIPACSTTYYPITFEKAQLPVEIQDIVIDYFTGDKFALQALSLASRQFRALAQPRCLKDITLTINASPLLGPQALTSPWSFLDLLDRSPHVALYVRSLSLIQPAAEVPSPSSASQVAETMAIEEVLSQATNLRSLWYPLKSYRLHTVDYLSSWDCVQTDLQNLIIKFHQQEASYPRHVDLRTLESVPGTVLSSFRSVRTLRIAPLDLPDLKDSIESGDAKNHNPNILDTLELCFDEDWSPWGPTLQFLSSPKSNFDLTKLNTLIVSSLFLTNSEFESIISLCAETLRHLVFRTGSDIHSLLYYRGGYEFRRCHRPAPCLSNLKRLESLTIKGHLLNSSFSGRYFTPVPWIGSFLTNFAKSTAFSDTFKTLHLGLDLQGIKTGGFPCLNWEHVVRVLVGNFHKTQLYSISFKFRIVDGARHNPKGSPLADWKLQKINNGQLRSLQNKTGIVSIS
ncbi:hypothetical protein BJ165DRAFT_1491231 [Panaeolus papilionaceus]|nr:hypothetical protein BJ165DRAFT_1491231 [Panaeolus papilionaceus]